jgi:hypothetical protein
MKSKWGRTLCPCCEKKVDGKHAIPPYICEIENNINDVDTLDELMGKYFYVIGEVDTKGIIRPCMCCFYRDMKHYFNVETAINNEKLTLRKLNEGGLDYEASA